MNDTPTLIIYPANKPGTELLYWQLALGDVVWYQLDPRVILDLIMAFICEGGSVEPVEWVEQIVTSAAAVELIGREQGWALAFIW